MREREEREGEEQRGNKASCAVRYSSRKNVFLCVNQIEPDNRRKPSVNKNRYAFFPTLYFYTIIIQQNEST